MIDGFSQSFVQTNGVRLSVHRAGKGAPLILLHGYPQNHACWSRVAPALAAQFDVIIPDLRGYGDSDAPVDDAEHTTYSKRTMARDIAGLMDALGIGRAHILGHDRGGRVAYRFALDHPDRLRRLGIIEIVPTGTFWAAWDAKLAMKAYHWTFLAQPVPLPEKLIAADPVGYIDWTLRSWTLEKSLDVFPKHALEAYRAQARDPARIHAMCADYRAGATIDRAIDEADMEARRKITAPLMYLWAERGFPAHSGDAAGHWRDWAEQVQDRSCVSGHFAMEEAPEDVIATFLPFFKAG
ncbi:alpha/beta fold hydrolase [Tropicimonas sp. S265A]|uniref:alpha/beta fold hydrolase n=1 Tax=Tropicimonas sp. S265A TaxID=3415134 RepID=UPI003C7EAB03